jgi:alpha-tubulin suppressor-like RCC1 family protein
VETCQQQQWTAAKEPCRWGCAAGACEIPVEIAAGRDTTYALLSGGAVWSWGDNSSGQLGQGLAGGGSSKPGPLSALPPAKQVAVHSDHACALSTEGAVLCWGRNEQGLIAAGGAQLPAPVLIPGLTQVVEVAVGGRHACARKATGEILCWGDGKRGQLGQGVREDSLAPVPVQGLGKVQQLALWQARSCALLEQGGVVCWGLKGADESAGSEEDELAPTPVGETLGASEVQAGDFFGCVRSVGLRCWGTNEQKQIGTAAGFEVAAKNLGGITDVARIALGARHGCVAQGSGLVKCWGASEGGQTGKTSATVFPPDTVPLVFDASRVAAGEGHSCALTPSGEGWCWGRNDKGQLGQGNLDPVTNPVPVVW